MTSITKHQYDIPKTNCANKENELSNGKRSEVTKSSSGIDSNFDWAKREAISQQRKLRLIEVRQQSKEIASQVRENVREEEKRRLDNFNRLKRDELLKWRQKQVGSLELDYKKCLEQVGEAHRAAERENAKQKLIEEQKEKNRKMALKRGKIAAEKIKENKSKPKAAKSSESCKGKQVVIVSKKVDISPDTTSDSTTSSSSTSSSDRSACSVILVEKNKKPDTKTKDELYTPSISPKRSSMARSPAKKSAYNPLRFASANNSSATDVSLTDSPMSDPPPLITKVSDLLGRKTGTKSSMSLRSSPHIAKTYKLDNSPVTSRITTKKTAQKPQINTVSSRLSRVIKTPTKTSGKSPLKVLPERKHFVPEFVKLKPSTSTSRNSAVQTVPQHSSKVQFYDHANRFARQYDGNIDLHEHVQNVIPLNAWEEAQKDVQLDEIKRHELITMKHLAENRSKVALEKEKIRKDYEVMTSQLSDILKNNELAKSFVESNELLSESRLRQIAEEKQQLMNKDIRKLVSNSTITCPKLNSTDKKGSASKTQRSESSDLNVAQSKPDASKSKRTNDSDISTESTHSFLLDFVTERTNNICEDINRCRNENTDKATNQMRINALHELLNKVNSFRRILCDEIKQNNGDISHIDASQFINEIENVEEKQHEIMKKKSDGKNSNQKQKTQKREQELIERERLLKIKENCIDEKARELYLREKKITDDKNQPKKSILKSSTEKRSKPVAVVSANGSESFDEAPVRIVINVNKNESSKEKSTDVIVNDMKWSEKLKKAIEVKETIQIVPVTNGKGKTYPKTPAKSNVAVKVQKDQLDNLSRSTSTTSYLSPPQQIRTQLTNAMQQQSAIADNTQLPHENLEISDNQLLNYIIRMLGMSRTSVEQLNMSSVSTIKTPNSSVVNVSCNRQFVSSSNSTSILESSASMEQLQSVDKAKLQQLARYLAENNKLAANNRKDSKESGASSGMWDEILSKKNEPSSNSEKISSEKQRAVKKVQRQEEVVGDPDDKLSRGDLIAKYDQLAASCTKRIINLDSMISKVREEKQKLLENTLSSASSLLTGQKDNLTEYMDCPQVGGDNPKVQQVNNSSTGSPLSDSKGTNAPSSDFSSTSGTADISMQADNRTGFVGTKNRPLGESKDSGVGISRPVTSSDYRESPDLKQNSKPSADAENNNKLLQNALRESARESNFKPMLKDIPKISYRISTGNDDNQRILIQDQTPETNSMNSRDKNFKPPPPAALTRYSPHMEDDLPHELSTITEVDTPATSRLNATENMNDNTLKNASMKSSPDEVLKLIYDVFPNFKKFVRANSNTSQISMISLNEGNATAGVSAILEEQVGNLVKTNSTQADEMNYKAFDGEDKRTKNDNVLEDSNLHLSFAKFPSHAEYAKSVPGLLDSQSLDRLQMSDANDNSNSSLPDIVSELKSRKILEHSFGEGEEKEGDLEDLLLNRGNQKPISAQTTEDRLTNQDESLSDLLENDLNSMGLNWVISELKKSKAIGTSTSSDSSNERSRRSTVNSVLSPIRPTTAKRTYQKLNQSKATDDSFVDRNLGMTNVGTNERTVTTQPTDGDLQGKAVNLKEFLARELLKHSSISSSSDSSLASMFLKSFLGHSSTRTDQNLSETPQNRGIDKHRTSTPVDQSSGSKGDASSKKGFHSSSFIKGANIHVNDTASPTFFDNESQLSSVRMSTTNSISTSTSADDQQKHKY